MNLGINCYYLHMNLEHLRENPKYVTSLQDFWLSGDLDLLAPILADEEISSKLSPELLKDLKLMYRLLQKYPDLKEFVTAYQQKTIQSIWFGTIAIVASAVTGIAYDDSPETHTPQGWALMLTCIAVSLGCSVYTFLSKSADFRKYKKIRDQYIQDNDGPVEA